MLTKIAWRNIWRSRTRSLVVIGAITLGVWALVFMISWMNGMMNSFVSSIIENQTSHIQIHNPTFLKERKSEFVINNSTKLLTELENTEGIKAVTSRLMSNGMISSPRASKGVMILGIDPEKENEVTNLQKQIKEGDYFDDKKRNPIIIGKALAKKLKVKVGKKISLQFQDMEGELSGQVYRIVGLYSTGNNAIDERMVYTRLSDLSSAMKNNNEIHEVAILVDNFEDTKLIAKGLEVTHTDVKVQDYEELSPTLRLMQNQIGLSSTIFTFIIMIALVFGIINTMMMAVLERVKEIGVLMAVGMNKVKIFGMIVLETIMLSMVGLPFGAFLGFLTIGYLGKTGIDLSSYEESMAEYGMATMVYPEIESSYFISISIAVFITALVASISPAFRAIRLKPIEAINKI